MLFTDRLLSLVALRNIQQQLRGPACSK